MSSFVRGRESHQLHPVYKHALVEDPDSPFFTTSHFDGHLSVLVRANRLGEVDRDEVVELVQERGCRGRPGVAPTRGWPSTACR